MIGNDSVLSVVMSHIYPVFGIFVPLICLLYVFTYIVYLLGEYKEKLGLTPKACMMLLIKFGILGAIYYNTFCFQIMPHEAETLFIRFHISVFGILVLFESIIAIMQLNRINKSERYLARNDKKYGVCVRSPFCHVHLAKCILSVYHKNRFILTTNIIINLVMFILILIGVLFDPKHIIISCIMLFILYIIVKVNFMKSLKNDILKNNEL